MTAKHILQHTHLDPTPGVWPSPAPTPPPAPLDRCGLSRRAFGRDPPPPAPPPFWSPSSDEAVVLPPCLRRSWRTATAGMAPIMVAAAAQFALCAVGKDCLQ